MQSFVRLAWLIAIVGSVVAACATQTQVVKLYENPSRSEHAYTRVFVVNLSSDVRQQKSFENEIVSRLAKQGVDAVASHTRMDASDGLLREDINRVSREVGADGILVSHVVSVDTSIDEVEGREEIRSTCRRGDPLDYFLYDRKVLREPNSVRMAHTVVVVTTLHDASTQDRVWTIQSTCFEKKTIEEAFLDEAEAIVRQLRIDRLI